MKNVMIPVNISSDIMITLNETEQNLKRYFQIGIAIMLFQEGKLTIGKAIQVSGLTRYEFEKELARKNIDISNSNLDEVLLDVEKLKDL